MIAVVPVRAGALPAGGDEAVAECRGRAVVIGEGTRTAAEQLAGVAAEVTACEVGPFAPASWAGPLVPLVAGDAVVVLPASPDGRDLAPVVARALGRPLHANAIRVGRQVVAVSRWGGLVLEDVHPDGPYVATLQPGVRGAEVGSGAPPLIHEVDLDLEPCPDPETVEVLPPDVATMDLAEAPRIVAGGAGLDGHERFEVLARVATALGASMGTTRVVTDRHWVSHQRQIGTTGVVVHPRLYLALGISGAVQHTSGLGHPDHIVSVNTDPHCPMMQLADLALVADANAVLDALATRLGLLSEPAVP